MFLQLRLSRDEARIRGAPGQATTGGRSSHQGPRAQWPVPGVFRALGRRAGSVDLVLGTGASSLFSPTWSLELPHTKELMQKLRETGATNGETVTGADLTSRRKHRL